MVQTLSTSEYTTPHRTSQYRRTNDSVSLSHPALATSFSPPAPDPVPASSVSEHRTLSTIKPSAPFPAVIPITFASVLSKQLLNAVRIWNPSPHLSPRSITGGQSSWSSSSPKVTHWRTSVATALSPVVIGSPLTHESVNSALFTFIMNMYQTTSERRDFGQELCAASATQSSSISGVLIYITENGFDWSIGHPRCKNVSPVASGMSCKIVGFVLRDLMSDGAIVLSFFVDLIPVMLMDDEVEEDEWHQFQILA